MCFLVLLTFLVVSSTWAAMDAKTLQEFSDSFFKEGAIVGLIISACVIAGILP